MNLCAQKARQTCKLNLSHRIGKVRAHASEGRVKEGLKENMFQTEDKGREVCVQSLDCER